MNKAMKYVLCMQDVSETETNQNEVRKQPGRDRWANKQREKMKNLRKEESDW